MQILLTLARRRSRSVLRSFLLLESQFRLILPETERQISYTRNFLTKLKNFEINTGLLV